MIGMLLSAEEQSALSGSFGQNFQEQRTYLMQYNLKGKTALITGASSGLDERMAFVLAEHGVKVILAARRVQLLISILVMNQFWGKVLAVRY